jgi:hypothetical protein
MGDPGREYEEAKSAYLAALERLAKAKAALPKDGPLMKSDLMREAAIERDMRIAESYRGGVTNARQLAELHGVSVSVVRTALWPIKHPEWAAQTLEWQATTLARIRAARGR